MVPKGGVHSLLSEDVERWEREVMPNVRHIVRGVVLGTAYLHEELSLQHVDLKGTYTCNMYMSCIVYNVHTDTHILANQPIIVCT